MLIIFLLLLILIVYILIEQGEKLAGYDILYQNFKCGSNSGRELAEFIKTRYGIFEMSLLLVS